MGNLKIPAWYDQEQITSGDLTASETLSLSNLTAGLLISRGAIQNGTTAAFQTLWGLNVQATGGATVSLKAGAALDGVNLGVIEVTADLTVNILSGAENQGAGVWGTGQAADATNPRKTVIGIKPAMTDTDSASRVFWNPGTSVSYSQSVTTRKMTTFTITVVHGVAAASPAEPALPAGYQKLAVITVPAAATTIIDANITKTRPYVPQYSPGMIVRPAGDLMASDVIFGVQNLAGTTTYLSVKGDGSMPELDARFVLMTAKGAAGGVATLDGTGKVPAAQLPAMNYIPTTDKGAAGGVATLDATGVLTAAQLPAMNYVPTSQKGAANGVATLDGTGVLTAAQIPSTLATQTYVTGQLANYVPTSQKGAANGVATLDATTKIPVAQIPTLSYIVSSDKGAAGGVATLDGGSKIPDAQIPTTIARTTDLTGYIPTSQRGVASGVASLDSGTKVPDAQIPATIARTSDLSSYIPTSQKGAASGVATLDGTTKIPDVQIPSTIARTSDLSSYIPTSQKGVANGVATLDGTTKIPVAQIPVLSYIPTSDKGAASGVATLDITGKLVQDAQTLGGYAVNTGAVSNTIPVRNSSGKLVADWLGGYPATVNPQSNAIVQRNAAMQIETAAPSTLTQVPRWQEVFTAMEYGLTVSQMTSVPGSSPASYYDDTNGPAISFADAATQASATTFQWPYTADAASGITNGMKLELVLACSTASTNNFRVAMFVKNLTTGVSFTDTVTVTATGTTIMTYTPSNTLLPSGQATAGDVLFIKISRLGTDAADTNTGNMRLYLVRPRRV
jgi:hypothetical protein